MKYKVNCRPGFTLIELLTVLVIISILSAVAIPTIVASVMSGQISAATSSARQIAVGLRMYAADNGGAFPAKTNSYGGQINTSNDAFRSLVPAYIDNEKVFTVATSKDGPKADNKIEPYQEILKPGENHYAYIEGLTTTSSSTWPLIVDGTDGSGHYTAVQSSFGGVWKGTKAVVAFVDGSASAVPLQAGGAVRFIPRFDDPSKNALAVTEYMGQDIRLLDPARP